MGLDTTAIFGHDQTTPQPVSPTDIAQYIRLDQCQRFLRLQLHTRAHDDRFLTDYDVAGQTIPPIQTRSGASFEAQVEREVAARLPATRFTADRRREVHVLNDNDALLELVRTLSPGTVHVAFQPRLEARVADWRIRGDVDLLRLERNADGTLRALIADMKSSTASKIEHRLQVAIYHEMLTAILADAGVAHEPIALAILYRGPVEGTTAAEEADPELLQRQREDAVTTLGTDAGYLERIDDVPAYLGSVRDLLTGPESVARRVLATEFDALPFHLTPTCDGCHFNEFCMKRSAETDDLSLLPHLTEQDKTNLRKAGIRSIRQLAALKTPDPADRERLLPVAGHEALCRRLAVTWPVGQRLDELIHRAHRYMAWKQQGAPGLSYIPNRGYGTLPYSGPDMHPNLVRVYIDAQHDYLHDRVYMVGALVVACDNGVEEPHRRRSIVRMTDAPPASNEIEAEMLLAWIEETLRAVVEVAAPDTEGNPNAPIHLIFFDRQTQKHLLNALGRYLDRILGATALYDFMTQLAMYDSPIASFLAQEIREQKNYPMVCQSLQAVAAFLGFDWNAGTPYRSIFSRGMFDFWGRLDDADPALGVPGQATTGWYTARARFGSQIPLEYAYAAWGEIVPGEDPASLQPYMKATPALMTGFAARRLEAMEHIARDFRGNRQTTLSSFVLPDLATFEQRAPTLAHALDEFISIERFVQLAAWKQARLPAPEQRVLNGDSLLVRYVEADQEPGIAERNRENQRRHALNERFRAAYKAAHPEAKQVRLPKEQKEASHWSHEGMRYRLRIETADVGCDLDEALNLSTIKPGTRLVLAERWTVDSRLPEAEQTPFAPTGKQLLYAPRVELIAITVDRDDEGRALAAWAVVEVPQDRNGTDKRGFTFGARPCPPFEADTLYTLDEDPNDINGLWASKVAEGLIAGGQNTLYQHLIRQPTAKPIEPSPLAAAAQRRFLEGLEALRELGEMPAFEPGKHAFIGGHGDDPVLVVQGPPGTGKSFSTAYAVLARIQGAMAAGQPYRVLLSCKTHAATDVLLRNVRDAQEKLRALFARRPELMARFFDRKLLDVPLYRQRPRGEVPEGITPFSRKMTPRTVIDAIADHQWCVTASTPGGIYSLVKDDLFGETFIDAVVLDEASQMSIPEAIMAALPLKPNGRLIVVGDHRQMPPIVSHDWANETRRTFREFRSYESLFLALLALNPPKINFEESFRLHADLAEFLRREIYRHDGIHYHSKLRAVLDTHWHEDPFIEAVLAPSHPLTVVVHDEAESQRRNAFEEALIAPILKVLADERTYGLAPEDGLGVVVPHRAQRAALQEGVPELCRFDPETKALTLSAVDTVERFQGDERTVILVGATESDPEYLLATGDFLLDPRRLTVALSRAKRKIVLVASRSVFELFSADEETFANAQLWKNLLRHTCTVPLWSGERHGHRVEVWGNAPGANRSG